MAVEILSRKLDGVLLIKPATIFEDHRGHYVETYNERLYQEAGIRDHFVQDDISCSSQNVLRGIHGDTRTSKLIQCLWGRIYLVVVNYDTESPHFKKWESYVISEQNRHQVLVPPKHGVGHLVLSPHAIFSYKQSTYYDRESQFTIMWDDPSCQIWWPISDPILSRRDAGLA